MCSNYSTNTVAMKRLFTWFLLATTREYLCTRELTANSTNHSRWKSWTHPTCQRVAASGTFTYNFGTQLAICDQHYHHTAYFSFNKQCKWYFRLHWLVSRLLGHFVWFFYSVTTISGVLFSSIFVPFHLLRLELLQIFSYFSHVLCKSYILRAFFLQPFHRFSVLFINFFLYILFILEL